MNCSAVIVGRTTELAEQPLTNGELRCPHCTNGQLIPWGYTDGSAPGAVLPAPR